MRTTKIEKQPKVVLDTVICDDCGDDFECSEEFAYGINECRRCKLKGEQEIDRLVEDMLLSGD
jgi:hypothetical protein